MFRVLDGVRLPNIARIGLEFCEIAVRERVIRIFTGVGRGIFDSHGLRWVLLAPFGGSISINKIEEDKSNH